MNESNTSFTKSTSFNNQSLIIGSESKYSKCKCFTDDDIIAYFCLCLSSLIIFCLEINLKEHKNSERLIHRSRAVKHKGMPNLYNDVSNKFDMFNKLKWISLDVSIPLICK